MTRKRYKKLLMSRGIDRNTAQKSTALVGGRFGSSYADIYAGIMWYTNNADTYIEDALRDMLVLNRNYARVWKGIGRIVSAFFWRASAAFLAFSNAAANAFAAFADFARAHADSRRNDSVEAFAYCMKCLHETSVEGSVPDES